MEQGNLTPKSKYLLSALIQSLNVYDAKYPKAQTKEKWLSYIGGKFRGVDAHDSLDEIFQFWFDEGVLIAHEDEFAPTYYAFQRSRVHELRTSNEFEALGDKYELLGLQWLRDAIEAIESHEDETIPAVNAASKLAHAANRLVSFKDNQSAADNIDEKVAQLLENLEKSNEFQSQDSDIRDAVTADISAGRELIKSKHFWLGSLIKTLINGLQYVARKFSDSVIGKLSAELIKELLKLVS